MRKHDRAVQGPFLVDSAHRLKRASGIDSLSLPRPRRALSESHARGSSATSQSRALEFNQCCIVDDPQQGGLPAAATCRKPCCGFDHGPLGPGVDRCRIHYRGDCHLGAAEFPLQISCDIEASVRIEGKYVKARAHDRAGPSAPKLNAHLRCGDALPGELRARMLRWTCQHLFELDDREPKEAIVSVEKNGPIRDSRGQCPLIG